MKASELIEFLQQHPEAEVILVISDDREVNVSSLEFHSPDKMDALEAHHYPNGKIYLDENRHF